MMTIVDMKYKIEDFLEINFAAAHDFSPDGTKIVYLSNVTGTFQMYLKTLDGKNVEQITSYKDNVNFASFSPVKDEIIFGMGKDGSEKNQLYLYDVKSRATRTLTNNPHVKYSFGGWSRDGKLISYASNERSAADFDIYVMSMIDGTIRMIFSQGGACSASGFSSTGAKLVVKKSETAFSHSNKFYLIDLKTEEAELLLPNESQSSSGSPKWLPDDSGFFFICNLDRDYHGLRFYDVQGKNASYVLTPNNDLDGVSLSPDGKNLTVRVNEEGLSRLTIYDTKTLQPIENQTFPPGIINRVIWSPDGEYLALNIGSATKNPDIWIWSKKENNYWRFTHSLNRVPEEIFVEPELIHYTSFDGLQIPAFLYLPKGRSKNDKMPTIVDIHGGPETQYRPVFNKLTQYFVCNGYAVIAPNVRGSAGYGKKYLALDDGRKRMDSVKDLESLHIYLTSRSEIDEKKIVLMGGSYGGFMVLAGLAFFPELWAAGVDTVGISNFVTFLENTAPYRRVLREQEYGSLELDREFLESISPLNHVDRIKAPIIIIHGKNDPRVPLSEAEQIYQALVDRGIKTTLLVYEDEGHGLTKLKNRLDAYPKIINFLDSCLK
jgi:dipeptidyl aminopeptidase/acylaminoacyl peptidase